MNPLEDIIQQAADLLPERKVSDARPRPGLMRAVLRLEIFGDDWYDYQRRLKRGEIGRRNEALERKYARIFGHDRTRPWVARLTGLTVDGSFEREFLRGQKDYSQANSAGSRGVYEYYALPEGLYEVHERLKWNRTRRYYIRVRDGQIEEINETAAVKLLEEAP